MSGRPREIIVVGAGIVGAACARALALRGVSVSLIDAGRRSLPLSEQQRFAPTTPAGMGHILIADDSLAQFELCRFSRSLWLELARELPDDCEFEKPGTLWLAANEEEWHEAERKQRDYAIRGVTAELIPGHDLCGLEPHLARDLCGALWVKDDALLYPPCATRWLREQAKANGAEFLSDAQVNQVNAGGVTLTDGRTLSADTVVVATGVNAPMLLPGCPVRPRKGHLVITDRYPGHIFHPLLELGYLRSASGEDRESVAFVVHPRRTGQLLIGSSRQYEVIGPDVDIDILRLMLHRTLRFLPAAAAMHAIRIWTGFRPSTPDKLPLIGPWQGVFVAFGHEGLGITTSLGTAEVLAAQVMGQTPPIDVQPYLPSRFCPEAAHA